MGVIWDQLNERQGGRSPAGITISSRSAGSTTMRYMVPADLLADALREGLELVQEDSGGTGLIRQMPVGCPRAPWQYLVGYTSVQGVSYAGRADSSTETDWEVPPIKYYAEYAEYEVTCQFSPRTYPLIPDELLGTKTVSYYTDAGASASLPNVAREWDRYVEWIPSPSGEFLTADIGTFDFKRPGGWAGYPQDGQSAGRGSVKILVATTTYNVIWHMVPLRWLTASNNVFDRARGRVNQTEFEGFPAGTLLFVNAGLIGQPYTHPFPDIEDYGFGAYPTAEKLCDLSLTMVYKEPKVFETYTPSNASFIAYGHNLVPYAKTGKWYYVQTKGDAGSSAPSEPIYRSYPFEFLFANPSSVPNL